MGWLKPEIYSLKPRKLEIWNQDVGRAMPSLKLLWGSSLVSSQFPVITSSPLHSLAGRHIAPVFVCIITWCSPCVSLFSYKDMSHSIRAFSNQIWLPSNYICKDSYFQMKSHLRFWVAVNIRGTLFDPVVVLQSLSHVWLFVTPWTEACQASLSLIIFWSLPKFMPIESVMPFNHLHKYHISLIFYLVVFPPAFISLR